MDNLKGLIAQLEIKRQNIEDRRTNWNSETRDLLLAQLRYYVDNIKSDWYVILNNTKANHETVSIAFKDRPSGIFDKEKGRHLSLIGGALHFSQIYNGKIYVWIEYPYIEEISHHNPPYKDIKVFDPMDLAEDAILSLVEEFFKVIIDSEENERQLIGFTNK